jgi:hypothetical protein
MNTYDLINGSFELVGAYFTWRNAYQLYVDRDIKGVYWPTTAFFSIWGIFNLFFYAAIFLPFSWYAAMVLTTGNLAWVTQAAILKFRPQLLS